MEKREAIDFIVGRLSAGETGLEQIKREASKRYNVPRMVRNPEILAAFPEDRLTPEISRLLIKKPRKTASGVTPVAVMVKPQGSCRHNCVYCPYTGLAAKSYVGYEPAALRGRQYGFDPYLQSLNRTNQYRGGGHATDKCEVIVMGGTFLGMRPSYREWFIKGVYEGLNGERSSSLDEAMRKNENSPRRAIGLTIETRPDMCSPFIDEMLGYGATRVELGVQHADDSIYRTIRRGHTVEDVVQATRNLKNAGFKVLYHIMPGLPGAGPEKDIQAVRKLFQDECFRPDMLKIYPTLVVGGTILKQWVDQGKYRPYSSEEAAEIISEFYRHVPEYVRVMRIQRDIPAGRISLGVTKSNLRELVEEKVREKSINPREIRYREVRGNRPDIDSFSLRRRHYLASRGKESFLFFENQEGLIAGFLRLRLPEESTRQDIDRDCALVRELHVYGPEAPISCKGEFQHHGLGSRLLKEAEAVALESGRKRMLIISGVGARGYYRRHGYSLSGPYMAKPL
ncbi:tRNA uridine(34) 5-carboxymethylaminomethyl modification radical SAM/GNAT enzyme Elp3 [Candidatus Micrarchaeota archaeon]|nr:tRNA uridine(34) 5-carboxymethylaminomethyl modification radical SAM/GNAT enzyme Elp3 [Candidatus Micrarchaeota archaeon]